VAVGVVNQKTLPKVLVTGGAGFLGDLLKQELLRNGFECISVDLERDAYVHPRLTAIQGDIRDVGLLTRLGAEHNFVAIFHLAAILAHVSRDKQLLWTSNVDGTRNIADMAKRFNIPKVIFISSNCLWGESFGRPVKETDAPCPVDIYGRSKLAGENMLLSDSSSFQSVVFRCPTIIDSGRLGLLTLLFEFIDEGRNVWVVGDGGNRYQFVFAPDLIEACLAVMDYDSTEIFNIGCDDVLPIKMVYEHVIDHAGTSARVSTLPKMTSLFAMKLGYRLRLSPLGPYQYKMIAEDFVFDTEKIKRELGWKPTLTGEAVLERAYRYYHDNRVEIHSRRDVSAHRREANMGIIRLLKWVS
jgi:nucleoside-diphosphate-sugar epimerase